MRATLEEQQSIDNVAVDFGAGTATFTAGSDYDQAAVISALEAAGYGARPL